MGGLLLQGLRKADGHLAVGRTKDITLLNQSS